ncbi:MULTISPECIES: ABC transporter ATP-binding protein [unclassified Fusibacter]|uniref:ABC transporter ATP-binding protein n=1 Tax=unclassified Fusibacter TaxID=2624464 RepID=UPI0010106FD7|nr:MULTISPECIES: ABC transporter ATP-binding protein [unclassified Fusibacter]MCK8059094.1 ABC transporter ATP-binding protein [Fusibacter sp. A2]NPE22503.1 ABC transporter ATP-binding protein [Fusibacter sp. A1]RXV60606.1 ABC transporter ATP-binding protein [Fusibacter sp. A1]
MSEAVITIKNLKKNFGNFTAVNGISFHINKGEIFGLLGPNGSGKSTTIRMLCGVITPTEGGGEIFGFNLLKDTEQIKSRIGYMSQQFSLYGDLTVLENMEFYGRIFGMKKKEILLRSIPLIKMAALEGKEQALARTLSGGQKQRLALSCALIHDPILLVLDEPTAGVDPVSRRAFWETIVHLSAQGVTVFVTTHYMDEAEICDRIGFIYNGNIISVDTPKGHYEKTGLSNLEDIFIAHELQKSDHKKIMSYGDMKRKIRGDHREEL